MHRVLHILKFSGVPLNPYMVEGVSEGKLGDNATQTFPFEGAQMGDPTAKVYACHLN